MPPALLDLPHGALNLHPSALPRHRGASPIPATILAGDAATGVTLMRMDEGLDTGPIVAQEAWPLDGTETAPSWRRDSRRRAPRCWRGCSMPGSTARPPPDPQAVDGVTLTRPLRREDGGSIRRGRPADLERQVRAYQPWPGTFVELAGERLVVGAASVAAAQAGDVAGAIVREVDGRRWPRPTAGSCSRR